jgi:predicted MFS family arabinose efflux permease
LSIHQLYVVAAAAALLTLVFDVAYQAYLPALIERERLVEGNARLALTESVAEVAGPGLTGVLVQLFTAPVAILFDALSFLASAISVAMIRKPEPRPQPTPDPHIGREIAEGLVLSWRDTRLRALAARTATASFFLGFPNALYILFVIRDLRVNAVQLGFLIAAGGAANLAGALLAERLVTRFGFARTFLGSALVTGLAALFVPLAHGPVWAACAFLLAAQIGDVAWPVYNIAETSLRQAVTPDHLLGRVNSAMHLLFRGVLPLGSLAAGVFAGHFGVRPPLLVGAVGFLVSALWLVCSPLRRLRELPMMAP